MLQSMWQTSENSIYPKSLKSFGSTIFFCGVWSAMPVLHRWDGDDDEKPATSTWRYDESSSGEAISSSDSTSNPGKNPGVDCLVGPFLKFVSKQSISLPLDTFRYRFTCDQWVLRGASDDDEDDASSDDMAKPTVNLTLAGLQSFHGISTRDDEKENVYSSNGANMNRIRDALKTPCSCKSPCRIPQSLLVKVCVTFWALGKSAQDAILWSLQCVGTGLKCKYSIEGWG